MSQLNPLNPPLNEYPFWDPPGTYIPPLPMQHNIVLQEETTYTYTWIYLNPSTGLPISLVGFRAEMQVRPMYNGEEGQNVALDFTTETNGGVVLGGTAGTVTITIPYTATVQANWQNGVYGLYLIDPVSNRIAFVKGLVTIIPSAMRLQATQLPDNYSTTPAPVPSPNNVGTGGANATS